MIRNLQSVLQTLSVQFVTCISILDSFAVNSVEYICRRLNVMETYNHS